MKSTRIDKDYVKDYDKDKDNDAATSHPLVAEDLSPWLLVAISDDSTLDSVLHVMVTQECVTTRYSY